MFAVSMRIQCSQCTQPYTRFSQPANMPACFISYPYVCLPTCMSPCLYMHARPICPSNCLAVCMFTRKLACIPCRLWVLSVRVCILLSLSLFLPLSKASLSLSAFIYISLSVSWFLYQSVSPSVC
jgi:hypothetical protein